MSRDTSLSAGHRGIAAPPPPVNGRSVPTVDQLFWAGYSGCFYLPSTVAPVGLADGKLPVGVQIIAGLHEDLTAIRFAALLEREFYAFVPPPQFP